MIPTAVMSVRGMGMITSSTMTGNLNVVARTVPLEERRKMTVTNDLISRSEAKGEILSWAVCLNKPHLLSKDDTMHILDTIPAVDAVSRPVFEQIQWERDCAVQQLKDHDIPFGGIAPDVVKVVRCKNCRRCDGFPGEEIEPNEIGICRINRVAVKPYDFCSYGERKADDG